MFSLLNELLWALSYICGASTDKGLCWKDNPLSLSEAAEVAMLINMVNMIHDCALRLLVTTVTLRDA